MAKQRILFISWTLGLGHITRDLAIARELRRRAPDIELSWLACSPANEVLRKDGENVLPESQRLVNETELMEQVSEKAHSLNLLKYCIRWATGWGPNLQVFEDVIKRQRFDLLVGDEAYEVVAALLQRKLSLERPFLAIHDFFGVDPIKNSLFEKLMGYRIARGFHGTDPTGLVEFLFAGELEDLPDDRFGFLLPNRRQWARKHCQFLGYIVPFSPSDCFNERQIRAKLGYGDEPLIVCSIGGTAIGKSLLELCGQTFPLIRDEIPDLRMLLVCGPRLLPESLDVPDSVEVLGYVPALFEHFAASDLVIVQGGGTTTNELAALRKSFLYFPLEEHFEQQIHVTGKLKRHGAGIEMQYSETTPELLAAAILENIGKEVTWPRIPADGAKKAAEIILNQLEPSNLGLQN
jgi:UDP:flavonoid glycosyltransferase YjiC (YdhE family)